MADLTQLAEQLVNLTVKEVKELTDILKDQYGIEPAAAGVAVVAGGAAGGGEPVAGPAGGDTPPSFGGGLPAGGETPAGGEAPAGGETPAPELAGSAPSALPAG